MKFFTFLLLLFVSNKECNKAKQHNTLIKGKVVHRTCATIAVQVLDEPFYKLGQASWQQSEGQPVYPHVFSVANMCRFPADTKVGTEFSFVLMTSDSTMADCVKCQMWDNPPTKEQMIKLVNQ